MAFKEYENPAELKKVQDLSLKILLELDRACGVLELQYCLWAGSALGAVRHQGFIPWDDDIDIVMLRSDYERFLKEAPNVLGDEYYIDNTHEHEHCTTPCSYLALRGTKCVPDFFDGNDYEKPLSIDIIPLDEILAEDTPDRRKQMRKTWFWGRLFYLSLTPSPYLAFDGAKRAIALAACRVAYCSLHVVGLSPRRIHSIWEKWVRKYEGCGSGLYADFSDKKPLNWSVRREDMFPCIKMPFCGHDLNVAKEYDKVLTNNYGDYMQLPPLSRRKNHRPSKLDFGKY